MNQPSFLKNKRILVTGGGGFLGWAVVRKLLEKGALVRSFSRRSYPLLAAADVDQVQGDIGDPEAVAAACRGVDTVFHVAAKAGVWGPASEFHHTNVVGTRNVIAACAAGSVDALVYTSSPSVVFDGKDMEGVDESVPYPDRYPAPYPQTKAQAEREVVSASLTDLKTIVLRPHLIWGPGDNHLVPRIIGRARHLRRVGDGRNRVDTIYIDNAADAHILAAETLETRPELSGRIYFISQGEPMPLWEMIDAILEAAGLPPVRKSISLRTARRLGTAMEVLYRFLGLENEPPMTRFMAEELATSHWFDIGAARRDLGYRPVVSTAEGLLRLARWLENPGESRVAPKNDP
ncbi:MAG: NAD-dependent epimerase/dehydratase family protein [Desulfobacterales bacterium]|jgi:2-alkyl-3-oxoalkanoate reductase